MNNILQNKVLTHNSCRINSLIISENLWIINFSVYDYSTPLNLSFLFFHKISYTSLNNKFIIQQLIYYNLSNINGPHISPSAY